MVSEFVLDCSVALTWCFPDEANGYASSILDLLRESHGFVPAIWPLEIANALLVGERRGRISQADAMQFLSLVRNLPVAVDTDVSESAIDRIIALARAHDLSAYDASYLELAMRMGVPIATLDRQLISAANNLGKPLISP
jgi:predicted nucleic acid-binding protein